MSEADYLRAELHQARNLANQLAQKLNQETQARLQLIQILATLLHAHFGPSDVGDYEVVLTAEEIEDAERASLFRLERVAAKKREDGRHDIQLLLADPTEEERKAWREKKAEWEKKRKDGPGPIIKP